jgi:hypothetical protein
MADLIAMLGAAAGAAAGGGEVDPNFNQTVLLLHGDGTNGAQNNTFLDASTNNFTITRNGNTTQGTFSPFSVGASQWSNFFDGSGDYLGIPSNAALAPGTGDFTVESWINFSSLPSVASPLFQNDAVGVSNNGKFWFGLLNDSGTYKLYIQRHATATNAFVNWTPVVGTWYHIAVVRESGTLKMFIDGVSQSVTNSTAFNGISFDQNGASIGAISSPYYHHGYISNVRYIVGDALYTATFTPSTEPLTTTSQGATSSQVEILTCQSNRFVDNSSNAFAITVNGDTKVTPFSPFAPTAAYSASVNGGSGYFDGSGDYLTTSSSTNLSLGSGDFTVEVWFYPTTTNTYFPLDFRSGTSFYFYVSSGSINTTIGSNSETNFSGVVLNAWNHFACVRSGGGSNNVSYFLNGVRGAQQTDTTNFSSATVVTIGKRFEAFSGNDFYFTGYLNEARMVKGTALYSGATHTVPTAPLTAVANTQLLLNFTNAGIFDQTGKNNLETVGNAQIDTTTKKYGTGSMEFDGTGDYLVVNSGGQDLAFGSGAFTIEFWVYINTVKNNALVDFRPNGVGNGAYVTLYQDSGGTIRLYVSGSDRITGGSLSIDTWYHIALTRSGTDTKLFIDGTQSGSTYTDSTVYLNASNRPLVGQVGDDPSDASFPLDGFIDDLRITKGVARYTAAFTPPTKAFPNL